MLTELERDALMELANMGVGRAAASLSRMVGEPVQLSVPSVEVVSGEQIERRLAGHANPTFIAVQQDFSGAFPGRALVLFPEARSLELVRAVVGPGTSLEEVADLEQEALAEIGNVILNGFLGTIANLLRQRMSISVPEVSRGRVGALFDAPDADGRADFLVLFLAVDFVVRSRGLRGYIALLMSFVSLASLQVLVTEFIGRLSEEGAA
jgi:chemotaxis protein CheC